MDIPWFPGAEPRVFQVNSGEEVALTARWHMQEDVSIRCEAPCKIVEACFSIFEMFQYVDTVNHVEPTGNW
jgi:hypothetical protein